MMEMNLELILQGVVFFVKLVVGCLGVWLVVGGSYHLIRNKWFTDTDFFGDKITGWWVHSVEPGARDLRHSFAKERCNACGQKNLEVLSDFSDRHRQHWLCGACGAKFNASHEVEVQVLRGCTDPIPELRRPATHGEVKPDGLEVRINVCKTCDGDKWVMVPQGHHSAYHGDCTMVKASCPDCYSSADDAPKATMSARRRAIEHTRAKVSAEEADRLKEPREDIISPL